MAGDRDRVTEIEGRIETQTKKAYLVELTNTGTMVWIPKSQVYDRNEIGDGLWLFAVSVWWVGKNPEIFG